MNRWVAAALLIVVIAAAAGYFLLHQVLTSDLLRRQAEQQLTARLGQPVRIGSLGASVLHGIAVDLREVSIGDPVALQVARIRVFTSLRAAFADTLDIREIVIERATRPGVTPEVAFDLRASVLGDRLDVRGFTARGGTSTITGAGALTSLSKLQGEFDASSDALDMTELVAAVAAGPDAQPGAAGAPSAMHLVVRLEAAKVRFGSDEFRDLSTTIDAAAGRLALKDLSVGLFGGTFKGNLDVATAAAAPAMRLNGALTAIDVVELLKRTGAAGGITGRLSGDVALTARGESLDALTRSAAGRIDVTVANGTLPHLDVVRTVVLAFGKPSGATPPAGTAFTTLGGSFALAGGALRSDNLTLRSRDLDTDGRGTLVLESGAVDARGDMTLSKELTAQAGTDLRRYAQEDGRVIVPATVSGTLANPTVFIDVAAAAKRAIGNEIKRRATDFLGGLFKKKKKGGGSVPPDRR